VLRFDERAEVLAALEPVDHLIGFDTDTPLALVTALRPDVLVKGADWAEVDIAGAAEVQHGGAGAVERIVALVPRRIVRTEILRRIREACSSYGQKRLPIRLREG
jgi:bifunctional ADP-heptose synthase (sugar kinase/adenylyltransferase)